MLGREKHLQGSWKQRNNCCNIRKRETLAGLLETRETLAVMLEREKPLQDCWKQRPTCCNVRKREKFAGLLETEKHL
jgi:hypothetical protein